MARRKQNLKKEPWFIGQLNFWGGMGLLHIKKENEQRDRQEHVQKTNYKVWDEQGG